MATVRMLSNPMFSAPGIVHRLISGYGFKPDQKKLRRVIADGWGIPDQTAHRLLSQEIPFEVDDEDSVVFTDPELPEGWQPRN